MTKVSDAQLERLVGGAYHNPHAILGAHPVDGDRTVIRALRPDADAVTALIGSERVELKQIHPSGVFAGVVDTPPRDYRLEVRYGGDTYTVDDPYRWLP